MCYLIKKIKRIYLVACFLLVACVTHHQQINHLTPATKSNQNNQKIKPFSHAPIKMGRLVDQRGVDPRRIYYQLGNNKCRYYESDAPLKALVKQAILESILSKKLTAFQLGHELTLSGNILEIKPHYFKKQQTFQLQLQLQLQLTRVRTGEIIWSETFTGYARQRYPIQMVTPAVIAKLFKQAVKASITQFKQAGSFVEAVHHA